MNENTFAEVAALLNGDADLAEQAIDAYAAGGYEAVMSALEPHYPTFNGLRRATVGVVQALNPRS